MKRVFCSVARHPWHTAILGAVMLLVITIGTLKVSKLQWRGADPGIQTKLRIVGAILGINPDFIKFINPDFENDIRVAKQIGQLVNHSTSTILLAFNYGKTLRYYGELCGNNWPKIDDLNINSLTHRRERTPVRNLATALDSMRLKHSPDYFIVTNLKELDLQKDLKALLFERFPILTQTDDYLIFDLRKKDELNTEQQHEVDL
jgi:hypothetical protein